MFEILIAHGIIHSIVIDKFHLDSFWMIEISTNLSLHRDTSIYVITYTYIYNELEWPEFDSVEKNV